MLFPHAVDRWSLEHTTAWGRTTSRPVDTDGGRAGDDPCDLRRARQIRPRRPEERPDGELLEWHAAEVFRT
jgi:hypothetical protein